MSCSNIHNCYNQFATKDKIRQWFPLEEIAQFDFHPILIFSHFLIFLDIQLKVIIDSNNGWESTWDFETSRFNGLKLALMIVTD